MRNHGRVRKSKHKEKKSIYPASLPINFLSDALIYADRLTVSPLPCRVLVCRPEPLIISLLRENQNLISEPIKISPHVPETVVSK